MFSRRKPEPEATPADFARRLKARPVRNAAVRCVSDAQDAMLLEVTLKYDGVMKLAHHALKLRDKKTYELEGIGLAMFRRIDGRATVEDLIEKLKDDEKLTFFEARGLVVKYLSDLAGKGLIALGVGE